VAYDGACSPNVSVRMVWISFGALPCRKKNLMTAHISTLLKSRASPNMLPFSLCIKKGLAIRHTNRPPLSNDTTNSVLRHWEVGRAKDLLTPPCILSWPLGINPVLNKMSQQWQWCTNHMLKVCMARNSF